MRLVSHTFYLYKFKTGLEDAVRCIIDSYSDVNVDEILDDNNNSPLFIALKKGKIVNF